jgi:S-ribosylhomocysteine lyase LuxS involved in autoinducer biosynthesis
LCFTHWDEISFVHHFTRTIIPLKLYTYMGVNEKYTIALEVCIFFDIRLHLPNDYMSKAYTQHWLEHVSR